MRNLDWMNHKLKLIKIARRNLSNLRYADDTPPYGRKRRGTKEPLDEDERGEYKSWLKTHHSKK